MSARRRASPTKRSPPALAVIGAGADEGDILAAMQGADPRWRRRLSRPTNSSSARAPDALLCRYKSGRRRLDARDQITLEFAGVWRHYHAALMRTSLVGDPTPRHRALHGAGAEALAAVEDGDASRPELRRRVRRPCGGHGRRTAMAAHRLNACGYSLGARFAPSWMDWPMFYRGNPAAIEPGMVLFAHMIIMDSEAGTAICLGRTYLTRDGAPEPLSAAGLELVLR